MNRRELILTASSTAIVATLPVSALTAPAPLASTRVLKWFAVGHSDEYCYPIRAANMAEAIDEYANYHGYRKGDMCPECDDVDCKEHLTPAQWDEPLDCIEEYSSEPKQWEGLTDEPTNVQWLKAGFNVRCDSEACRNQSACWETQECYEHEGKALCDECCDIARRPNSLNNSEEGN